MSTDLKNRLSRSSKEKFFNGIVELLPHSRLEIFNEVDNDKMVLSMFSNTSIKLEYNEKHKIFNTEDFYYEHSILLFNNFKSGKVKITLLDGSFTDDDQFETFEEIN